MSRAPERADDRPRAESITPEWTPRHSHGAHLRVFNAAERHEEIARVTGLTPTRSHVRGDLRSPLSDVRRKNDVWVLASPLPRHLPMSAHLEWLWEQIGPHADYFRSLAAEGVVVDLWCTYTSDCDHCGFTLEPGAARIVGLLGVPVQVSTVFAGRYDDAG